MTRNKRRGKWRNPMPFVTVNVSRAGFKLYAVEGPDQRFWSDCLCEDDASKLADKFNNAYRQGFNEGEWAGYDEAMKKGRPSRRGGKKG